MDYGMPSRRKNKNDKKAKARFSRYKKGGGRRSGGRAEQKESS